MGTGDWGLNVSTLNDLWALLDFPIIFLVDLVLDMCCGPKDSFWVVFVSSQLSYSISFNCTRVSSCQPSEWPTLGISSLFSQSEKSFFEFRSFHPYSPVHLMNVHVLEHTFSKYFRRAHSVQQCQSQYDFKFFAGKAKSFCKQFATFLGLLNKNLSSWDKDFLAAAAAEAANAEGLNFCKPKLLCKSATQKP